MKKKPRPWRASFTVSQVMKRFADKLAKPDLEKARNIWLVVAARHAHEEKRRISVLNLDGERFFVALLDEVREVWEARALEGSGQQYQEDFFWPLVEIINAAVAVAASLGVHYFPHFDVPKTRQAISATPIVWRNPAISEALTTNPN